MKNFDFNMLRNLIGGLLAGYGFGAFFCFLFIEQHWANVAPKMPDPTAGLIFLHNEHGSFTYFSAFQATSCALLFATSIPLSMLGMLIAPRKNIKSKGERLSWSATWDRDDPRKNLELCFAFGIILAPIIVFIVGPDIIRSLNQIGFVVNL